MEIKPNKIPGCYEIIPKVFQDYRGRFVKTFHRDIFQSFGLETKFHEEYYSVSGRNVLRGLHFQRPPQDHIKLVYCIVGEVMDVVVDLRLGSPTYGQFEVFSLSSTKANMVYIPSGLAHGFYVFSETATLIYKTSTVYSPEQDTGILWNSVGIPWSNFNPVLSERDQNWETFAEFQSPFQYHPTFSHV